MDYFADKVVMITGAPGDVGSAVTRAFADRGAKLALINLHHEPLKAKFADLADALLLGDVDVTQPDPIARAVQQVMDRWGRIDVLVNTVGTWRGGQSLYGESALDTWDFLMNINARSVVVTAQAVAPIMIAQGSGKIVSVGARSGLQGSGGSGAYSAAKAALQRATESLSESLKNQGINVNAVLPSTIDTEPNRQSMPKADPAKWVAPDALADVIVFLASDAARAIHGASIPVYGRV
jgi:NAD(P)-dependent dehydrogenase (short-subunit alcohol dehydrogenase family)